MKRVIVIYGNPKDPAAFDRRYKEIHIPLCRKMPKLKGFEASKGKVASSDPADGVYYVAILTYDSQADLEHSLSSPEGVAAVEDVATFATGGARILTIEAEKFV